ncbi:unnamed protein product [Bursaphelenchus xylophilus]|uniref:(pine wood nematode) hypothetical protein n=1 Tax=Bursaphelenchus xylophilus TaxID=6326 RepID=A0A1I7S9K2_BURXY|nr:unnamed protein product [Bursaphelenchus xylophilus]CAG9131952.1 unnamed protein product [Bursaphelenchus xylophilus]
MDIYCPPGSAFHPMDPKSMYAESGPAGVPDEPVQASELLSDEQYTDLDQLKNGCVKAQQWFRQNYYHDSGFQSMESSKPASIMSMNAPKCPQRPLASPECQSTRAACDSTQMEPSVSAPLPANDSENARRVLPELIPLLDDPDEEVACRALEMVGHIAKLDSQQHYSEPVINDKRVVLALTSVLRKRFEDKKAIRVTLCALFHISNRDQGMDLILSTVQESSLNNFLADLIRCIHVEEWACFKYALLILHNLMTDKNVGKRVVDFARTQKAMAVIVDWLADRNEKLLAVTVDILQLLCDKNADQKALFVNLNGPAHLCSILSWARYENLLWRTVRLIKSISVQSPQRVVESGAFDVLPISLDYPSQRVVTESLICTRDLSDVPTDRHDITPLLAKLVQLLALRDTRIRQLCVQALANLSANNRQNKEFLCSINVVGALKCVLFETEEQLENVEEPSRSATDVLEDIQENALTALRNLYSGHRFDTAVQQHILSENGAEFFLRKLVAMRPALLRKTLLILAKTAAQEVNLPVFRHARITMPGHVDLGGFADRIVYILHVAASKSLDSQSVENINLTELMHLCMTTLERLCADSSMHRQTLHAFKALSSEFPKLPTIPPFLAFHSENSNLQQSAILLLNRLVADRDIANAVSNDSQVLEGLESWAAAKCAASEAAFRVLKNVKKSRYDPIYDSQAAFVQLNIRNGRSRSNSPCYPMNPIFNDSGFGSEKNSSFIRSPNYSEHSGEYYMMDSRVSTGGYKMSPGTPESSGRFVNMNPPYPMPEMDDYPLASVFCPNSDGQSDEMANVTFSHEQQSQKNSPVLMDYNE